MVLFQLSGTASKNRKEQGSMPQRFSVLTAVVSKSEKSSTHLAKPGKTGCFVGVKEKLS